ILHIYHMNNIIKHPIIFRYRYRHYKYKLFKSNQIISKRSYCINNNNNQQFTIIYTDGACKKNGRIGSQGGIGVYFGDNDIRNISEKLPGPIQTNQRAELYVCMIFYFIFIFLLKV